MRAERAERTEAPKVGRLGCFLKGLQRGLDWDGVLMCFTNRVFGAFDMDHLCFRILTQNSRQGRNFISPMDHIVAQVVRIIRMKCGGLMSP